MFQPTHTLTINGRNEVVAVFNSDWQPCDPEAGSILLTEQEYNADCWASYQLNDDGCLTCNGSLVIGEWWLTEVT